MTGFDGLHRRQHRRPQRGHALLGVFFASTIIGAQCEPGFDQRRFEPVIRTIQPVAMGLGAEPGECGPAQRTERRPDRMERPLHPERRSARERGQQIDPVRGVAPPLGQSHLPFAERKQAEMADCRGLDVVDLRVFTTEVVECGDVVSELGRHAEIIDVEAIGRGELPLPAPGSP